MQRKGRICAWKGDKVMPSFCFDSVVYNNAELNDRNDGNDCDSSSRHPNGNFHHCA